MSAIEIGVWGDVPTWIGAISTTLALLAAGGVVWIEMRREKRAERATKAAQADLVAAWHELTGDDEPDWVVLRNGSPLPVYDFLATLVGQPSDGQPGREIELGPPSVLAPGELRFQLPLEAYHEESAAGSVRILLPESWGIRLIFVDAGGRVWSRHEWTGRLTLDADPEL